MAFLLRLDALLAEQQMSADESRAQSEALVAVLNSERMQPAALITAASKIASVKWASPDHLLRVQSALTAKGNEVSQRSHWSPQNYTEFLGHLPAFVWDALVNPKLDMNAKLRVLFGWLQKLGLKCPSEPTFAKITAVTAIACDGAQAKDADNLQCLYQHVKSQWKASRPPPPPEQIFELPLEPSVLSQMYPLTFNNAFGSGHAPEAPRFSVLDILSVTHQIQMRKHGGKRTAGSASAVATAVDDPFKAMFMQFCMQAMRGNIDGPRGSANSVPLTIFPRGSTPPPRHPALGMLEPPNAELAGSPVPGLRMGELAGSPRPGLPMGEVMFASETDAETGPKSLPLAADPTPHIVKEEKAEEPSPPTKAAKKTPAEAAKEILAAIAAKKAEKEEIKAAAAIKDCQDGGDPILAPKKAGRPKGVPKAAAKSVVKGVPKAAAKHAGAAAKVCKAPFPPHSVRKEAHKGQMCARWGKGVGSTRAVKFGKHATGYFGSEKEVISQNKNSKTQYRFLKQMLKLFLYF